MEKMVLLEWTETKVPQENRVLRESLVWMDPTEKLVLSESLDQLELPALEDHKEKRESGDRLDLKERRESKELAVLMDLMVMMELPVRTCSQQLVKESPVRKVLMVPMEPLEPLAPLVPLEIRDPPEIRVRLEPRESPVCRVLLDKTVMLESLDHKAPRESKESLASKDQ